MKFTAVVTATMAVLSLDGAARAEEPDIFGYFEPQYFGFVQDGRWQQMQTGKLRIDLSGSPHQQVRFGANVNLISYNGKVEYSLLDYLPDRLTASIEERERQDYAFSFADTIYLDNAYMKLAPGRFDLTLGRQQVSYGTGYAWNPTYIFAVKDVLDPTYEQPGTGALRVDFPLRGRFNCMALYSPGEDFERSIWLVRLKGGAARFDLSLTLSRLGGAESCIEADGGGDDEVTIIQETRSLYGGDLVGELLGMGVWFEAAWNRTGRTDDFCELLAGCDYTLDNGTYLMGELYHNSRGHGDPDDYRLCDWLEYLAGGSRSLGKNSLYLHLSYPAGDLVQVGTSAVGCLSDGSLALVPQLVWSPFQNTELTLMANILSGSEGATFSSKMGSGVLARLRVYF